MKVLDIHVGDVVRLKKVHPCGGFDWEVEKIGFEVRARCIQCNRQISLVRSEFERHVRKILPGSDA